MKKNIENNIFDTPTINILLGILFKILSLLHSKSIKKSGQSVSVSLNECFTLSNAVAVAFY